MSNRAQRVVNDVRRGAGVLRILKRCVTGGGLLEHLMFPSVFVAMVPTWVWTPTVNNSSTGRDAIYSRVQKYLSEGRRIGVFLDVVFDFRYTTYCSCCSGSDFLERAMRDIERNVGCILQD